MSMLFRLRPLPVLAALMLAAPASADTLEVHVAPDVGVVDEEVKAAIAAELAASIVDASPDLGIIEVQLAGSQLAVTHRRPDGTRMVRIVTLPALPADRLAMIAFVTGNLVRDQLADLGGLPVAALAPAAAPSSAPVPAAPPATAAVPPAAVSVTTSAAPAEAPEVTVPFSIGLVPPLSSDRLFTSRARVRGALNVIVGASSSIDGMSISGVADLSANVRGLQIGGAVSVAGDTRGMQLGGAATVARALRGGQLAGAVAVASDTTGLQIAGAGTVARDMFGIQIAGAASAARDMRGIQIAGAASVARDMRGIQIAGASAVARRSTGLAIAGGAAVTERLDGAQIASINVAGSFRGMQLGAINVAGHADGLQLGAINISDSNDGAQIGALNFVRHGRTDLDAWAETTGLAAIALRHGGRYVHNVYAIGWTPDGGETPLVGLGLGYHNRVAGGMLDLDGMAWQTHMFKEGMGLLSQARATFALDLGPFDAFIAAAYNVSVEDRGDERPLRTTLARTIGGESMTNYDVALWPSVAVGVRGHLGAMR